MIGDDGDEVSHLSELNSTVLSLSFVNLVFTCATVAPGLLVKPPYMSDR